MATIEATNQAPQGRCCPGRWAWRIPFIILAVILVKSALVMILWNHLIPALFHGPIVSYGQAIGLVILAKILFGHGFRPGSGRGRFGPPWARWQHMSPEERLKLREELHKRHSCHHHRGQTDESCRV